MGELLKGKVVVVTGSGRGIGRAISLLMAEEGAKVVVNDLGGAADGTGTSARPAEEVVAEIKKKGGTAVPNFDSVATPEGGEGIIKTAMDNFGRIDVLVNNAGIIRDRMIFNMTPEDWDVIIKVHLYGHFYCTKPASIVMRQQRWGRIINVSSPAALGNMGQANYGSAKAGILGFTRCVARDLGRYGVTCNALIPGAATRLSWNPDMEVAVKKRLDAGMTDALTQGLAAIPTLKPEDNAPLVVFLASDAAAGINGCTFQVWANTIHLYSDPVPVKTLFAQGAWTVAGLVEAMPKSLARDLVNPAPPQPTKEKGTA